jgi:hypothetical protein
VTYIVGAHNLGSVSVQIPARAARPREAGRPSPHEALSSPLMLQRFLRPRGSAGPASATLSDQFLGKVIALKGQQAQLEKLLANMVAELKTLNCSSGNPVVRQACALRKAGLEQAIDAAITQIKNLSGAANAAALDAVKTGASKADVTTAAVSVSAGSGNTAVVESATIQVTPAGTIVPGPGAVITAEPVTTAPGASVSADVDTGGGISLGKVALGIAAAYAAYRVLKKA